MGIEISLFRSPVYSGRTRKDIIVYYHHHYCYLYRYDIWNTIGSIYIWVDNQSISRLVEWQVASAKNKKKFDLYTRGACPMSSCGKKQKRFASRGGDHWNWSMRCHTTFQATAWAIQTIVLNLGLSWYNCLIFVSQRKVPGLGQWRESPLIQI
jgi:hypothetical protein